MPRKGSTGAMVYVSGGLYSNWPECLVDYAWLVESGVRQADNMFNVGTLIICKVCGGRSSRQEMPLHVAEHVNQLKAKKR